MEFENDLLSNIELIKIEIFCITQHEYSMLEISTEVAFSELEERFESLTKKLNICNTETENYFEEQKKLPDIELISKINNSHRIISELNRVSEHLKILCEMRIIYLFKSVETNLKSIIEIAYPKVNLKDFFKWDNLNAFFKSLEIDYSKCPGYYEVDELRKVNNSVKHNSKIKDDLKNISEFKMNTDVINYSNYNNFYNRVKPFANKYVKNISDNIIAERFDFNEEKLINIAENFKLRMDNNQIKILIEKLQK